MSHEKKALTYEKITLFYINIYLFVFIYVFRNTTSEYTLNNIKFLNFV